MKQNYYFIQKIGVFSIALEEMSINTLFRNGQFQTYE